MKSSMLILGRGNEREVAGLDALSLLVFGEIEQLSDRVLDVGYH